MGPGETLLPVPAPENEERAEGSLFVFCYGLREGGPVGPLLRLTLIFYAFYDIIRRRAYLNKNKGVMP